MATIGKYESTYAEYLAARTKYNLHPEISPFPGPADIATMPNVVVHGPPGVGKYTQSLALIRPFSASGLKHTQKFYMTIDPLDRKKTGASICTTSSGTSDCATQTINPPKNPTNPHTKRKNTCANPTPDSKGADPNSSLDKWDKPPSEAIAKSTSSGTSTSTTMKLSAGASGKTPELVYRMSDAHYEVDMQLLGSGSKYVWHELFFHIIDLVISQRARNPAVSGGIIVCKNFHLIENDLLAIFYSYMNHPVHHMYGVHIRFLLITDNVCFFPTNILARVVLVPVRRPTAEQYKDLIRSNQSNRALLGIANIDLLDLSSVQNIKELYVIASNKDLDAIGADAYTTICAPVYRTIVSDENTGIIGGTNENEKGEKVTRTKKDNEHRTKRTRKQDQAKKKEDPLPLAHFRNQLYNILLHKMDVYAVIQHVLSLLVYGGHITNLSGVMPWFNVYFHDYNWGYRSIFHIERIFFRLWSSVTAE